MTLTKVAKIRRAKARSICQTKKRYATDLDAAHMAGAQALRTGHKLYIYKCPAGNHWHLTRSKPDAQLHTKATS
jgi:hypothetical protein